MSTADDITISNLRTATTIGSDKLSAHHPNGAGNSTAMGDFVVNDIGGGDLNSSGPSGVYLYPDKLVKSDGTTYNQPSGSYNANDEFVFTNRTLEVGDTLHLLIQVDKDSGLGEHWREQIAKLYQGGSPTHWTNLKAGVWTVTGFSASSPTDQAQYYSFNVKVEFSQFDSSPRLELAYDQPLNKSITGTSVVFQTEDVDSNLTLDGFGAAPGPSIAVTYDYSGGGDPYDIDITRKQSSSCGGGPYSNRPNNGNDFPKSRSSTGSFTYDDTNVTSGNHYCYHIEITDNTGAVVSGDAQADAS